MSEDIIRQRRRGDTGLTDKGAESFMKATSSIERASRNKGLLMLESLMGKMDATAGNPALAILDKFFGTLLRIFNAQFAEVAERLAKALYSEESVERMGQMADNTEKTLGYIGDAVDAWEKLTGPLDNATKGLRDMGIKLEYLQGPLGAGIAMADAFTIATDKWTEAAAELRAAMDSLMDKIQKVADKINALNLNAGGGGGGGDDGNWWDNLF